jgi:uncharacterized protein
VDQDAILQRTEEYVREALSGEGSGHDWWHVYRVRQNARHIGQQENVDLFVVQLAALLHDIADWKFHDGDETVGPRLAREWLTGQGVPEPIITHVCEIIATLSFKGAHVATPMRTREGMVVQDADRLDALGAVGIARVFAYGGHAHRAIYDPTAPPQAHQTAAQYKQNTGSSINHFYEKLLLLQDRMNTLTARQIAAERHQFMEQFLERFFQEWDGNA